MVVAGGRLVGSSCMLIGEVSGGLMGRDPLVLLMIVRGPSLVFWSL